MRTRATPPLRVPDGGPPDPATPPLRRPTVHVYARRRFNSFPAYRPRCTRPACTLFVSRSPTRTPTGWRPRPRRRTRRPSNSACTRKSPVPICRHPRDTLAACARGGERAVRLRHLSCRGRPEGVRLLRGVRERDPFPDEGGAATMASISRLEGFTTRDVSTACQSRTHASIARSAMDGVLGIVRASEEPSSAATSPIPRRAATLLGTDEDPTSFDDGPREVVDQRGRGNVREETLRLRASRGVVGDGIELGRLEIGNRRGCCDADTDGVAGRGLRSRTSCRSAPCTRVMVCRRHGTAATTCGGRAALRSRGAEGTVALPAQVSVLARVAPVARADEGSTAPVASHVDVFDASRIEDEDVAPDDVVTSASPHGRRPRAPPPAPTRPPPPTRHHERARRLGRRGRGRGAVSAATSSSPRRCGVYFDLSIARRAAPHECATSEGGGGDTQGEVAPESRYL